MKFSTSEPGQVRGEYAPVTITHMGLNGYPGPGNGLLLLKEKRE